VSAIAVLGFLFPFFVELMSIVNDECKVNFVLSEILQFKFNSQFKIFFVLLLGGFGHAQ